MRNLFALLFVAAAFTFASCGKQGGEQGAADSTAKVDSIPATDPSTQTTAPDSLKTDTTSSMGGADTTAKK